MSDKPILKLSTTDKDASLTLREIGDARRLLADGQVAADMIDKQYPGWRKASAGLDAALAGLADAARQTPNISAALKSLDASRDLMGDTLRQATASLASLNQGIGFPNLRPPDLPPMHFRDPDAATREVADEVRDLAGLVAAMAESAEVNAQVATASLDQTRALLVAVKELDETTRLGIAAGEARDAAAAKRDRVLVGLTWALFALTAVLAISEGPHAWAIVESWGGALGQWMRGLAPR